MPAKSGIKSLKNILTENPKTPILDDSFSLWDEVYGVTETESKGENNEENEAIDEEDSVEIENLKEEHDIKQFAKNMVRNINSNAFFMLNPNLMSFF